MSTEYQPNPKADLREKRSYARVVRASVIWGYLRAGFQTLLGIPTTVILARLLTPEEFGLAAAALFFGQLSSRLSAGGMGQALVRIKDLRDDHISTVFTINAGLTALLALALLIAAPAIGRFYGAPEVGWLIPVVAVTFAVGALSSVQQALLNRDLRYRESAMISSIDITVSAIASVVFAAFGFRYWSLVLGDMCGALAKFTYAVYAVGLHAKLKFVPAAAREMGSFAAGSFVRRLLEFATRNVDNLVVGRVLGMAPLGFYDKAFSLVNRLYSRMTVVGPGVSFRVFSIIQDEPERFRRAYHKVVMTTTIITYAGFAALGVMAPHLVVVAFGERWRPSIVPCQLLCVSFALKAMNQYAVTASHARGWIWPDVWRQIVGVTCVIGGVYFASGAWGIDGAAAAVLMASLVMFLLTQGIMRAATGMKWADTLWPQAPGITIAALLVTTLWAIDGALGRSAASPVILLIQALAAVVVVLMFAMWCPFREARILFHDAVNDLSPKVARRLWSDVAIMQLAEKRSRRGIASVAKEADA
jgi:PST family polysaccharide transporter